jgi:hypothetical protein
MRIKKRWRIGWWVLLLEVLVTSCARAQAPTLVASYPLSSSGGNSARAAMGGPVVVETVALAFEVGDPEGAADTAARLANGCGGYEADRYAWNSDGGRVVSQEIFVPIDRSNDLHARLLQMGWKNRESDIRRSNSWSGPGEGWAQYSIQFLPAWQKVEWNGSTDDWGHSHMEKFLGSICRFFGEAAAVIKQLMASLLLAAAVVIPCVLMIVGIATTIRWLFNR